MAPEFSAGHARAANLWSYGRRRDRCGPGFAVLPGLGLGGGATRSVPSLDGKKHFYLARKEGTRAFNSGELWFADLRSGSTEVALPGILMNDFDLAPDGSHIAFTSLNTEGSSRVWISTLDRSSPPRQLVSFESDNPSFAPSGALFFRGWEGGLGFVYRLDEYDTSPRKISPNPVPDFRGVSPDGEWWLLSAPGPMARSVRGGPTIRLCNFCDIGWGPGGRYFYVRLRSIGAMGGGKAYVIALPPGPSLPALPASGIRSAEDLKGLKVVAVVDMSDKLLFAPGRDPVTYSYARMSVQRNIFRIPLN